MDWGNLSRDERTYFQGQDLSPEKFNRLCPDAQNQWKQENKERAYKESYNRDKAVGKKTFFITK